MAMLIQAYTQFVTKIMTEWLKQPLIFAVYSRVGLCT